MTKSGMLRPKTYEECKEYLDKQEEFYLFWLSCAPKAIVELMEEVGPDQSFYDIKSLIQKLDIEFSSEKEKVFSLVRLFGVTMDFWTGYPIYEEIPKTLLEFYGSSALYDAVNRNLDLPFVRYGFARFFGFREVYAKRRKEYPNFPDNMRNVLLNVMTETNFRSKKITNSLK